MLYTPRHVIEERWRQYRLQRVERSRRRHEKRVKGMDLVFRLDDGRKLEFRGRHYGVPPVPWKGGLRALALQEQLNALMGRKDTDLPEWYALCASVALLFNRLTSGNILRRLLWRWWPSPFRKATISEVVQALSFFCMCVRLDAGESPTTTQGPRGTSPSTSRVSSPTSPRGATGKATLAAGSTS